MNRLLTGKEVADAIYARTKKKADLLAEKGGRPTLAIVRVGQKKSDLSYERGVRKHAGEAGILVETHEMPEDAKEQDVIRRIEELNTDEHVSGILLFMPLPSGMNEAKVVNAIHPSKDMDGATEASRLSVYTGRGEGFPPCTPQAVMEILSYYGTETEGRQAVIIGRSLVVGKPLSMMLLKKNATVTICHSKTRDLASVTQKADILISAAGHIGTVDGSHIKDGQVLIDVGINFNEEGRLTGDILLNEVTKRDVAVTPVPGGVGAVTTAVLMEHTADAKLAQNAGKENNA